MISKGKREKENNPAAPRNPYDAHIAALSTDYPAITERGISQSLYHALEKLDLRIPLLNLTS